jgi:endo-1,4-beta-xylanase
MRVRRTASTAVAVACAWVGLIAPGVAGLGSSASAATPDSPPLRALAAPIGLKVGTAVAAADLDDPAYAKIAGRQFSVVTPENELKWESVEPTRGTYDWSAADRVVDFARAHGQQVRGHVLLWHNQNPAWLVDGVADGSIGKAELRAILHRRITDEVRHFKGRIWQWDVANEFLADAWSPAPNEHGINGDDFWVANLGEGIIADAFRWAHAADPHALLFYNDYNITGEDGTNAKSDAAYALAKRLLAEGVPIDGVGEQAHLDTQYGFDADRFRADLQRFASLGLKVAVTEADVRTFVDSAETQVPTDPAAVGKQSDYWRGLLDGCLAVRQCISFTAWGVGDAFSWVPGWFTGEGAALLYDVDLRPKAEYRVLQQELRAAKHTAPRR